MHFIIIYISINIIVVLKTLKIINKARSTDIFLHTKIELTLVAILFRSCCLAQNFC